MEEGQEKMGHLKSNGRVAEPPLPLPKKHITTGVDREEQCHKTPCTVAVVLAASNESKPIEYAFCAPRYKQKLSPAG